MRHFSGQEFEDVDRARDPCAGVAYLESVSGMEGVQAYKRRSFELLRTRRGDSVLDVGCGSGDDLVALAALIGPAGQVVGVDSSETMIGQARERTRGLCVECCVGDAHALDFSDERFDSARSDRVFQHLADPPRALAELVRVTRRLGRIVVVETDWGTLAVDSVERAVTRRILEVRCDQVRHGWVARRLFALAREAGLTDVDVEPSSGVFTDFALADPLLGLAAAARAAASAGAVGPDDADRWIAELATAGAEGRFFASITGYTVSGSRP